MINKMIDALNRAFGGNRCPTTNNTFTHKALMDAMTPYIDNGNPKVGIFWYDISNKVLFGVEKDDADKYILSQGYGTLGKLHKTYWAKQHHRAVAKGNKESIFFIDDNYTRIPRGRVFVRPDGTCFVAVGEWFNGKINGQQLLEPNRVRELIADEFNLPDNFEVVYDTHWDVGHGWSGDNLIR